MGFLNKLEKKFGKYAIPHLTRYILVTYVAGYILLAISQTGSGGALSYLTLSPALILRGQVWRLVSWILIPPTGFSIFTFFMLFFYYYIGTQLERAWGDFLYNVYIFMGLLLTIIGAFLLYAFTRPMDYGGMFSTYYVSLSLLLAFAMTYPDHQVYVYFLIPLKMKWLAIIDLAFLAYEIFRYAQLGYLVPALVVIGCSLANALIFFLLTRKHKRIHAARNSARQRQWQRNMRGFGGGMYGGGPQGPYGGQQGPFGGGPQGPYGGAQQGPYGGNGQQRPGGQPGGSGQWQQQAGPGWNPGGPGGGNSQGPGTQPRHRCAICGRTELDNPDLEFRYCTRCKGYYEYCQDHLFTHTHRT